MRPYQIDANTRTRNRGRSLNLEDDKYSSLNSENPQQSVLLTLYASARRRCAHSDLAFGDYGNSHRPVFAGAP
jgi:hypothetical protein